MSEIIYNDSANTEQRVLNGRRQIFSTETEITKDNLHKVLSEALMIHAINSDEINYLYWYLRGRQPILAREKTVRPEINNKVVENHAIEIAKFTSSYFLGEPLAYVHRGDRNTVEKEINVLNDYMFYEDKASHDKELADWMALCGVGYRMILPDKSTALGIDDSPFEIDTLDPRNTFVVYNSGFGHKRLMGVQQIATGSVMDGTLKLLYCGYTPTHYFEIRDGANEPHIWQPHSLCDIPIFEYRLNMEMTGSFEPALLMLDALNNLISNRLDGIEQFIQSFLVFENCDIDSEDFKKLKEQGCLKITSVGQNNQSKVYVMVQELNQQQTQTLVDFIYERMLNICGLPTSTKGGSSTSDTGTAVIYRDGWKQTEARAKDTEQLFKRSEKQFLKLVLRIMRDITGTSLSLADIDYKFTRRQSENITVKAQALTQMLEAGIVPEEAIATSGLFNDPRDVTTRSSKYLEKWEPQAQASEAPILVEKKDTIQTE